MLSLTSPHRTFWHSLPIGFKFGALLTATAGLFFTADIPILIGAVGAAGGAYLLAGWPFFKLGLRQILGVWPFLLIILIWNGLAGTWELGAVIALRMIAALSLANIITLSTQLSDMMQLMDRLLRPLARLGVPTHLLGLAFAMVIRFTPRMMDVAQKLQTAWRARSPRRAGWRIAVPMLVAALDDADHVALALRARGGVAKPTSNTKD